MLGPDGTPSYPSLAIPASARAARDGIPAAVAAQAYVRDLLQKGDRSEAVNAIYRLFRSPRALRGLDSDGRAVAMDQRLLLINLLPPADRRRAAEIASLTSILNNYAADSLPAPQRLFLMSELLPLARRADAPFPTLDAERLAIAYLEHERGTPGHAAIRVTNIADVWQLTSQGKRVIALYRTRTLTDAMAEQLAEHSSAGADFFAIAPGGSSV